MFDELGLTGYGGGRAVLKDYLRTRRRRRQPAEQRFFVRSGQMQVDWGELGVVEMGPHRTKPYVFVAVMAWSSALFVRFTTDMQMLTWLDCHRRAFAFFGGVPNQVLVDNLGSRLACGRQRDLELEVQRVRRRAPVHSESLLAGPSEN